MLRMTDIRLEKINNTNIHLFIEEGMRGGISYISKRYSKSTGNTLHSEEKTIMYWDMNNLYGTVMSFDYLPYCNFKFLSEEKINNFDIYSINENNKIGYILEVDLEYCKELHEKHNDQPLCPEHILIKNEMLSKYCK